MKESGHYSIAGFFFQLLASASDALKLYFSDESKDEPIAVFSVEKLGQDGVIRPICGNSGKIKLIQYKYSSEGRMLGPNDLRKILEAFRKSVEASGLPARDFEFCLTTNRVLDAEAKAWMKTGKSKEKFKVYLHKNLSVDSAKEYRHTVLYPIFRSMEYDHRDLAACENEITKIADRHGMHDHEIQAGINTIVGFLNEVARSSGERKVNRQLLLKKLVGHSDPVSLTSERSLGVQLDAVKLYKDRETQRTITIDRTVYNDIANAARCYPFVLVQGEGGCGKSVAVSEAARLNLESREHPPGFAIVVKAAELGQTSIQLAVKSWRKQVENPDQTEWELSIARLRRAKPDPPILAIYVDGIDERHGLQGLPSEARSVLSRLIFDATTIFATIMCRDLALSLCAEITRTYVGSLVGSRLPRSPSRSRSRSLSLTRC
ncbi:hypothetical protein [Novipirellula maiorica]|uniref:hypothetical protein n=1 Tax=Novipirellula maiorica TaxID=1265734 RepID=UPI000594E2B0|nr:hypothetical protein [Rhodopirellula maiorica]